MASNGFRDYFQILGVQRKAKPEEIKTAFRKLARKYHPDINPGNSAAESKFKEINEAYEVLSDPDKRRRYEQYGQFWNKSGGIGSTPSSSSGFDVDFAGYGSFDDFINDLLGRFSSGQVNNSSARNPSPQALNLDAEVTVQINLTEAFHGTERILSVNEERVQVLIPKGVKIGSRLRLQGKGNIQPGTGQRGDLYLKIDITPHEIWRLEGDQLRADLPVLLDELVLGAEVKVVTPDGEVFVSIPPGTAVGSNLRLKGKGWPLKDGRGDLIFTVVILIPNEWTEDELELLKKLQKIRCKDLRKSWVQSACL
mgnify:CR=1 FL=1